MIGVLPWYLCGCRGVPDVNVCGCVWFLPLWLGWVLILSVLCAGVPSCFEVPVKVYVRMNNGARVCVKG